MSQFDTHFKMNEQDAIAYAKEKLSLFAPDTALVCSEIGDGNINYVFRVEDPASGQSVIIKHADIQVRSSGASISTDRNRIEAEVLQLQGKLAPGLVPKIYLYDPVMCCMVMEDLRDYENMRYALIAHKTFSTFVEDITTFMAETLLRTTDTILTPAEKKEEVKRYINPALCGISERLVYTAPYTRNPGNVLLEENAAFFEAELYDDVPLRLEVAKLKCQFQTKAQALIHGDLHTGSIFVKEGSTMVLDPEFAFYGPIGYDVGNVVANLLFGWANGFVTIQDESERNSFLHWVEQSVAGVIDRFCEKALAILQKDATDIMAQTPGFAQWYVKDILADTAGVAGLEINRRIVGAAKVKDIAGIADRTQRVQAERICVLAAKAFIQNRQQGFRCGADYVDQIKEAARLVTQA